MTTAERIDRIIDEGPQPASALAELLGSFREGRPTHPRTITRWMLAGIDLPDGRRLKLEHVRAGGRLLSSRAALTRFLEAQQIVEGESAVSEPSDEVQSAFVVSAA